jgi:hypothetical protein
MTTISSGSQTTQVSRPHRLAADHRREALQLAGIGRPMHGAPNPPDGDVGFRTSIRGDPSAPVYKICPQNGQPPSRGHSRPPRIHPDLGPGTGRVRVQATARPAKTVKPIAGRANPGACPKIPGPILDAIPSIPAISSTFDSLFKVLFIFPSRYLFAIGLPHVFSFG